ncbi:MAG TPA: class I SAM-dependent methyltransferase [bacterium]|nr:class I SAM-dependent methyltransferase [bacterium]
MDHQFTKDYFFGKKLSNYKNYNLWDNSYYWKDVIKYVKKNNLSGKILDVGCAFGFMLKRIKPYFNQVYGIDISEFAIDQARKNTPTGIFNVINLNKEELPFPDNFFDFVTAFDVLEHTDDVKKSLNKITSKIKNGGQLMFSMPLKNTWAGKIFSWFDKDVTHVSILEENDLLKIVKECDLKIIKKGYYFNALYFKIRGIPVDIEIVCEKNK